MTTQTQWWQEPVVYQIYPRSFNDSNGDGIGDLPGITEKIPYLADLGIQVSCGSPPSTRSPNDDNGYDISDYRAIMTEFGTMADFDELLDDRAQARHQAHDGPGRQPQLATSTNGSRQARSSEGQPLPRLLHLARPRRASTRTASPIPPNNWISCFCPLRLGLGRGAPASSTCTTSPSSSPTSTGRTRRSAKRSTTSCASGWTRASTASAWTSST